MNVAGMFFICTLCLMAGVVLGAGYHDEIVDLVEWLDRNSK